MTRLCGMVVQLVASGLAVWLSQRALAARAAASTEARE